MRLADLDAHYSDVAAALRWASRPRCRCWPCGSPATSPTRGGWWSGCGDAMEWLERLLPELDDDPSMPPAVAARALAMSGYLDSMGGWGYDRSKVRAYLDRAIARGGRAIELLEQAGKSGPRAPTMPPPGSGRCSRSATCAGTCFSAGKHHSRRRRAPRRGDGTPRGSRRALRRRHVPCHRRDRRHRRRRHRPRRSPTSTTRRGTSRRSAIASASSGSRWMRGLISEGRGDLLGARAGIRGGARLRHRAAHAGGGGGPRTSARHRQRCDFGTGDVRPAAGTRSRRVSGDRHPGHRRRSPSPPGACARAMPVLAAAAGRRALGWYRDLGIVHGEVVALVRSP